MFNSIRWSFLLWQAVILVLAVVGFGTALYVQVRHAVFQQLDADLLGAAQSLATLLQAEPPGAAMEIPASYRHRFGKGEKDTPYFRIWNSQEQLIAASDANDAVPPPGIRPGRRAPPHPYWHRDRGPRRELVLNATGGHQVLVGRDANRERGVLQRLLAWTVLSGAAILLAGLVGSWLLSRRALAPIERMTAAAETISAASLSHRLDAQSTKSELGRLAQVLNSTFARLEAAFERQSRFTADASHELRTPVSVVLSQTELALARERAPEEYRTALAACQRAARRMKALVDGLLMLARADAGELQLRREAIDLGQVAQQCAAMLQPLAQERQVDINVQLEPVKALADGERIGQVITNLLTNAILYNRAGGRVSISLDQRGDAGVFTVSDTGIGIAPEDQQHLFERFFRVDVSRSGARAGSGLGLAICREVVLAHDGRIELTSELGVGTTVTVWLPLGRVTDGSDDVSLLLGSVASEAAD